MRVRSTGIRRDCSRGRTRRTPAAPHDRGSRRELVPSDQREHRIERDCLAFPFPPATLAGLARGELDRGIGDDETDTHQLVRAAVGARLCLEMRPLHDGTYFRRSTMPSASPGRRVYCSPGSPSPDHPDGGLRGQVAYLPHSGATFRRRSAPAPAHIRHTTRPGAGVKRHRPERLPPPACDPRSSGRFGTCRRRC